MRSTTRFSAAVRFTLTALLSIASFAGLSPVSRADTEAAFFNTPYGNIQTQTNRIVGWSFTPNSNLQMTQVGWFDLGANGLNVTHDVGIWTDTGTLLAQQTVDDNTATLQGNFWYTPLGTTLSLNAGSTYIIGGTSGSDPFVSDVSAFSTDPAITYIEPRRGTNGTLQFPNSNPIGFDPGFFGPNFKLNNLGGGASVPEPGAVDFLSGCGVGSILWLVTRRRARMA